MSIVRQYARIDTTIISLGSDIEIPFSWAVGDKEDLQLKAEDIIVPKAQYTVNSTDLSNGGTVVLKRQYADEFARPLTLSLERFTPLEQPDVFDPYKRIDPNTLESSLDNLELQIQEVKERGGDVSSIKDDINNEKKERIASDTALGLLISNEINNREYAISGVNTSIANESIARINEDNLLNDRIEAVENVLVDYARLENGKIQIVNFPPEQIRTDWGLVDDVTQLQYANIGDTAQISIDGNEHLLILLKQPYSISGNWFDSSTTNTGGGGDSEVLSVNGMTGNVSITSSNLPGLTNALALKSDLEYVNSELYGIDVKLSEKASLNTASPVVDGLMSSSDKLKLDSIEEGVSKTVINNTLTSSSTTEALSASQGKVLNEIKQKVLAEAQATLSTSGWTGSVAPWTQTVTLANPGIMWVGFAENPDAANQAIINGGVMPTSRTATTVTFKAYSSKPTANIVVGVLA